MENFRWLSSDRFAGLQKKQKADGFDITVQLSPYETPKGVGESFDPEKRLLHIMFRYIDSEPGIEVKFKNGVMFVEGRHTGKLLAITIPLDHLPIEKARLRELQDSILDALKSHMEANRCQIGRELNLEAAEVIIGEDFDQLMTAKGRTPTAYKAAR